MILADLSTAEAEKLLKTVCDHISMGGSPVEWAQANELSWVDLSAWLNHKTRKETYYNAFVAQNEWAAITILKDLRDMKDYDIRKILNADGTIKKPDQWPDSVAKAVESMDVVTNPATGEVTYKISTVKKQKSIELLMKNLGILNEKIIFAKAGESGSNGFIESFFGLDKKREQEPDENGAADKK